MGKEMSLTQGSIVKSIVRFSVPFLLANILQGLYSNVDAMVVGNYCDAAALSAVSTGGTIMFTINSLVIGMGEGATVLVGQYYGARAFDDVKRSIGTIFVTLGLIALAMMAVLQLCAEPLLTLVQTPDGAREGALEYTRICYVGLIFTAGYNAVSGVLRGMGDTKRPLIFVAVSCVLNIILDIVFVGGFEMGAAGAALATVVAQAISFILSIVYLKLQRFIFDFKLKSFTLEKSKVGSLMKFGMPIGLQNFLSSASFVLMFSIVNYMGVIESATAGVADKIGTFAMMPAIATTATVAAFAAQNVGARQIDRARKGYRATLAGVMLIGAVFAVIMAFFPQMLMDLYTDDREVIEMGWRYLVPYAVEIVLVSYAFCIGGLLNGCGHTHITMIAHLVSTFAVRVPIAVFFGLAEGATILNVALAMPISTFVQSAILMVYYLTGKWKKPRSVVREEAYE